VNADCVQEISLLIRAGWKVIALETFEEERVLRVLERTARSAKRKLSTWSVATGLDQEGAGSGSLDEGLRAIAEVDEPAVFAILDARIPLQDFTATRRLRDMLSELGKRRQVVVLVGAVIELPLELEREAGRVTLPLPDASDLHGLFERVVESVAKIDVKPDLLDACVRAALGLTGSEAVRVFRKAWMANGAIDNRTVSEIIREKRQALRRTPALTFHDASAALADVGGLGELKHWLRERRRAFGEEARGFGLPEPRGLLLLGVQGCGKSLSAKAIAREWGFPLLRLDLAAAFGDVTKSPEVTIREATSIAESLAPAVLWIDEIEKGFAATGSDPGASRVFGSFLTWLSEKQSPVFVAATANDVTRLPPELLRRGRFDELFFVDLPSELERVEILSIHLRKRGREPSQFPLQELAIQAERLSGAEIEQVVTAGLYTAFSESRDLTDNDLANAIQETVPLYETYEERIKELRNWARTRARSATLDVKMVNLFETP
jgi:AAA+ superfamily predicted ATPase